MAFSGAASVMKFALGDEAVAAEAGEGVSANPANSDSNEIIGELSAKFSFPGLFFKNTSKRQTTNWLAFIHRRGKRMALSYVTVNISIWYFLLVHEISTFAMHNNYKTSKYFTSELFQTVRRTDCQWEGNGDDSMGIFDDGESRPILQGPAYPYNTINGQNFRVQNIIKKKFIYHKKKKKLIYWSKIRKGVMDTQVPQEGILLTSHQKDADLLAFDLKLNLFFVWNCFSYFVDI